MSITRIASRYAKSLLDLAVEQNKVERVLEDIQAFRKAVEVRDLYLLLKSPIINLDKKGSILKILFEEKFDELTMAFLNIIVSKGREPFLPEIADTFVQQYRELKNIATVKLTTATPWNDASLEALRKKLEDSSTGGEVEIVSEVDPKIIGGFVLEFDNKLYDASVAHQLEALRKEFSKN
ncbi:MAG: ATP synthase F1 subunit delta [Bacteroidota bacterium]